MLRIGLTGGIGAGKTAVSNHFNKLGVPVIDTDVIARQLVTPGSPALGEIIAAFGPDVLTNEQELDRKTLGRKVFSDPSLKVRLESILHPRIKQETVAQIQKTSAPYCIVVVPLLLETGFIDLVDKVLVIDAPEAKRLTWVQRRDHIGESAIKKIMASQKNREERLAAAHYVIENDGSIAELEAKVEALHQDILANTNSEG